ncbi:YadA family autotransporter adhesin [Erythrobacter sp. 3-20A1M]|uniref:YadA family autotransporter adhesin n=1 Tax=Erythrobacter sp. 3-20A1M TaxID=2653850 RepID=UPI001BFC25B0|nr:YadA-like family protein [Erythrobacter sp. 3-20A1M]
MNLSKRTYIRISLLATASVVMAGGAPPRLTTSAKAQALQPVVDVCTGISLDPSAVTDIVGDVAVPTATAVENLYGALLNVSVLGNPILTLDDVQIGAADTLEGYANGDPISLQVADTSGTLLAPGADCNLTADGYALNEEAGLAIGGNQISGLGDGQAASAGELDAIAFGNNASTAVGATGAIALGTNASATAANSVALGNGSLADRGALVGYVAPGLPGTYSSVGSVSVGAPGSLRQITNVAPGTQATDAATVGQVQGAVDALQAALGNGVQYDGPAQASVTLAGAQGTTVTNLADGTVSAGSTDAVNGSQLFATNQQVAANADGIDGLDGRVTAAEGDIADLDGRVTTIDTRVTQNTTDIADLQSAVDNVPIGYVSNGDPAVASPVPTNRAALIGADPGTVTLSNVGPGALAAGSADAVNGSQLFATNQQVDANTAGIQANADAIASLSDAGSGNALAVLYDDATRTSLTLDGAGGTTVGNVADGELSATSGEAVNGSQLFATNQAVAANSDAIDGLDDRVTVNEGDIANLDTRVTTNEGDIANLDGRVTVNEGDIASLDGRVTVNEGDIASLDGRVTVNEGDISNLDGRVTVNEGDIADLDTRVAVNEGDIDNLNSSVTSIDARVTDNTTQLTSVQNQLANVPLGYVSDTDPTVASTTPTNTAALIGAGDAPVRMTNVADGALAAGSTDAVNGSQLAATNDRVASNRTDIDQNTANIAALNNNIAGSTVVAVQYSDPDDPAMSNGGTVTNDVALVGADATAPVALHNVAAGTRANDAVNLGQVQNSLAAAMADSRAYTDLRFGDLQAGIAQLDFDLKEARRDASAGTASAMAVSGIPQTITAGRSMVGTGIAHYEGETAFALGMSTTFSEGRGVVKAGATVDTRGNSGFSAGAGFSF